MVSSRNRVAVAVLTVLIALPIASTVCAVTCIPPAAATTEHHGPSSGQREHPTHSSGHPLIHAALLSDCPAHEIEVMPAVRTGAEWTATRAVTTLLAIGTMHESPVELVLKPHLISTRVAPPGAMPAAASSFALRI
jgi:hypothetical protein